jgi:HPr kinase/phosphorylase
LPYHMEARGLGIIDISRLFGVAAVRPDKRITLAITLVRWGAETDCDRLGLCNEKLNILGVEIPHVTIPVSPGRNVGTLVEVASLNQKLKSLGIDTARMTNQTLLQAMDRTQPK